MEPSFLMRGVHMPLVLPLVMNHDEGVERTIGGI